MTIKKKLLALIGISSGGMIAAVVATLLLYLPLDRMQQEQKTLYELEVQVTAFRSAIVEMSIKPLEEQWEVVGTLREKTNRRFDLLEELEALPSSNEKVAESIETVDRLRESLEADWDGLQKKYESVMQDISAVAERIGAREETVRCETFTGIYKKSLSDTGNRDYRVLLADLDALLMQIDYINTSLDTVMQVMKAEFDSIDEQIAAERSGILRTSASLFFAILCVSVAVAMLMARGIGKSISRIFEQIGYLSKRDLTVLMDVTGRDDLGKLGGQLNDFIGGLNRSLNAIKEASGETILVKDRLLNTVEKARGSVERIGESSESIGGSVEELDERMEESIKSVDAVGSYSGSVLEKLQEQTSMVEESSASITEMISSITNVSETAEKRYAATSRLTDSSRRGSEKLNHTTSLIEQVTENVDDIREATGVIQNVAAQTSLLAMNAAIEAAHAGDAGAGFAVVAEEIRKLSETTSNSSKRIGTILKEVIDRIEEASTAGKDTQMVFDEMSEVIEEVAGSFTEITGSMKELNAGGEQILEATTRLQEFSNSLKESGTEMESAAGDLTKTMEYTRSSFSAVTRQVEQIGTAVGNIREAMQSVSGLSGELDEMTGRVDGAVKVFVTEQPPRQGEGELQVKDHSPGLGQEQEENEQEAGAKLPAEDADYPEGKS